MRVYATTDDLFTGWDWDQHFRDPDGLLRQASALVEWYTSGAIYGTDRDGYPVHGPIRAAFRDATVAQARFWAVHGLDPSGEGLDVVAAPVAASKTIRGASVSYDTGAAREAQAARVQALTRPCHAAYTILWSAGLVTAVVQ